MASRTHWRTNLYLLIFWCLVTVTVMLKWSSTVAKTSAFVRSFLSAQNSVSSYTRRVVSEVQCPVYSTKNCSTALSISSLSKELVIRRVYFDPRKRNGHSNATVFLIETKRGVNAKSISGCRIGTYRSEKFHFRILGNYFWALNRHRATEILAMLDCYDIPQPKSGDSASLFYTSYTSGFEVEVLSLQPLVVPEAKRNSTATVVVCVANVFVGKHIPTEYGMIYHWLRYQKTIGVDHVHMIVEDSFVRAGGFHEAYSQQAIKEGFLSIDFWPKWLNETEVFYHSQMLAYEDCLYRFQGVYDYVMYCDSDDFFVPLKNNKSLKHYLQTWCGGKTGACRFEWRQFYPDCGWDPASVGSNGNLTATISYKKTTARSETKSAHQLKALVDAGVHTAVTLVPGYVQKNVPSSEAYFAHLKQSSHPAKEC